MGKTLGSVPGEQGTGLLFPSLAASVGDSFNFYLRRGEDKNESWVGGELCREYLFLSHLQTLSPGDSTLIHAFLPQKHWHQWRGRKVAAGPGT